MTSNVVFVSYYTPNYEPYVNKLRASLVKFGLEHDLVLIKDQGGWQKNVRYKPVFIRAMLLKHTEAQAIVWIDADGLVLQHPQLFSQIRKDVAFYFLEWSKKAKYEMLSGTVYLRNNARVLTMMDRWIEALAVASPNLQKPEQQVLQALFTKWGVVDPDYGIKQATISAELPPSRKVHVSLEMLPHTYCQIRNWTRMSNQSIVIEHGQASRQWRYDGKKSPRAVQREHRVKGREARQRRLDIAARLQKRKEKRNPRLRASRYRRRNQR